MAETITYADLRFVKAPLKKSISNRLGQEADEDEELTYENVQVSPVPGGSSSLAASGLGGKAGMESGVGGALAREQEVLSWESTVGLGGRREFSGKKPRALGEREPGKGKRPGARWSCQWGVKGAGVGSGRPVGG